LQADASGATVAAGAAITVTQERQLLDAIIRNAQRLKRLTENLLDVSRIDSRSLRLKKQPVDLTGLVADAMQDFRNTLGPDSKVELILNPSDSPILTVDEERVNQVVSNLLHNSLKFVQEGTVEVDVIKNQHEVVVTVKDSGEGIHPDVLPKLFVKFVSRSDSGTGLGLYIAKGIVEAHGGRIWAENNADGKGASFHFTLPIN
ncbi:MAG TPA: HAMP domain-containing sensor histidine kinase, partial [Nitrososphaera sp.]|nr:HAMP domain-containing sensor histidine kinase [Nitrososphaera sp.]